LTTNRPDSQSDTRCAAANVPVEVRILPLQQIKNSFSATAVKGIF
jgi:hypothetical protein